MKRIILSAVAACSLLLAGCQTPGSGPGPQPPSTPIVTQDRCNAALTGLTGAQQLVDVLVSFGIARDHADVFATLLGIGKLTVTGLCALFLPGKPLPRPGPLPPPAPDQ